MAMNHDMDDLLRLYRRASNEAPDARIDARILRAAENVSQSRRRWRSIAWPIAMAASLLLFVSLHGAHRASPSRHDPMAGYDAGRTQADMLRMDVAPPRNEVDRFLMNATSTPTGNAP